MKSSKVKKMLCAALASCSILSLSIPAAFASTVDFDITNPGDTLTRKTDKNTDGSQYFYVTPHYFNKTGTLNCLSVRYDNTSVYSYSVALMPQNNRVRHSAKYRSYAEGGKLYYMSGTTTIDGLNVSGSYTP